MATLIDILSAKWPGVPFVGSPDNYESLKRVDGGEMPSLQEIESYRGEVESLVSRDEIRSGLRASWDQAPSFIRGVFHKEFIAANELLDLGQDDAALDLITFAVPPPDFTEEQISVFESIKSAFSSAVENLTE